MNTLNRTRLIFFIILGMTALLVCGLIVASQFVGGSEPTPVAGGAAIGTATPAPTAERVQAPEPIFAPGADLDDGLPTYVCEADAFGSYFTLQQMQMQGIDVKHGFHLGIIPFFLDEEGQPQYNIDERERVALMEQGDVDCLLTTLDSVALHGEPLIVTAFVDQSAGADLFYAREGEITQIERSELRGKRITFVEASVSEYFARFVLYLAGLQPQDVELRGAGSMADAVEMFNNNQADAISGWEPDIFDAEQSGGVPLLSSEQMRVIIDVVTTSPTAIQEKPELVQSFHDAWFETLKVQFEEFDTAAQQIASWGNNDWTFVYQDSAGDDLEAWLANVAQATLEDNVSAMNSTDAIVDRLNLAQRIWASAGLDVHTDTPEDLIDPRFVRRSSEKAELSTRASPVNDTFALEGRADLTQVAGEDAQTLAVLPCRQFSFQPESTILTRASRKLLDDCVAPALTQSIGLSLQVTGSAAWPTENPETGEPYSRQEILDFARARAESVVNYLVEEHEIDRARFKIDSVAPEEPSDEPLVQEEHRFVEMRLIVSGR